MKAVAIIPAAGMGTRMRSTSPKQFLSLAGVPILVHTLRKFARCQSVSMAIVPMRKSDISSFEPVLDKEGLLGFARLVPGGVHRQDSVYSGFQEVDPQTDIVVVHDAVRPFVELESIDKVIAEAHSSGSAILAIPCTDTVKQIEKTQVVATLPRDKIVLVQTPQAFRYSLLKEGLERAQVENFYATDESCLVERLGYPVTVLRGSEANMKITKPADLPLAELLIRQEQAESAAKS
ncbi:MAG: 2-C-methyl-D-erythritol 4-phosphate cytidylyltransferase [Acidobacteria bacterium]|nr:2-C-methyl-D-erythritol 4-phosphate cytidylyltransferase [Acidobacteriota bacterium]MCI0620737.1 2-C-methyl-D-erythritol 4-phosphate cytidylyltransferase [Acidobacteriota bacterium]